MANKVWNMKDPVTKMMFQAGDTAAVYLRAAIDIVGEIMDQEDDAVVRDHAPLLIALVEAQQRDLAEMMAHARWQERDD